MTNKSKTLYTGVTNNLERRVYEHKQKLIPGFTLRYNIDKLVYFEITSDVKVALAREKQIKGWLRNKKLALIESVNPEWNDLSSGWFAEIKSSASLQTCHKRDYEILRYAQNDKNKRNNRKRRDTIYV